MFQGKNQKMGSKISNENTCQELFEGLEPVETSATSYDPIEKLLELRQKLETRLSNSPDRTYFSILREIRRIDEILLPYYHSRKPAYVNANTTINVPEIVLTDDPKPKESEGN